LAEVLGTDGHAVHVAVDGRTGIALAHELEPDVVVCDIGLPDLDGFEVARALRADPALAGARLIAFSGHAMAEDLERSRSAGFDAHLRKPASVENLLKVVAG
jgi:CheY-like chemotaxis protein